MNIQPLDFSKITRLGNSYRTSIQVKTPDYRRVEWIRCGVINIQDRKDGLSNISAKADATDFEHDSISVFSLEVVGVKFDFMDNGRCWFSAWIRGDTADGFRIPGPDYDPFKSAKPCKECKGKNAHLMVPEGFYVPKANENLWTLLKGCHIEICTGPLFPEDTR